MIKKFALYWMSLVILRIMDNNAKNKFRKLEKLSLKLINLRCHLDFNRTCLNINDENQSSHNQIFQPESDQRIQII